MAKTSVSGGRCRQAVGPGAITFAVNQAGEPYHVVHQYDRHKDLAAKVVERIERGSIR